MTTWLDKIKNKLTTPNLKNGTYTLSSDNNVVLFEDGIEVGRGTKITFNHNGGELAVVPLGTVTQMQLENGDTVSDWKPAWEDLPNSQKPARLIEGSGTYTYTGSDNLDNYTAIVDVFVPNGGTLNGSPLVNGINKIEGSGVVKIELSGDGLIFTNPQIKDYFAHSYGAKSVTTGTIFNPITKIRMYYDDESAFEYGDDSGSTLEIDSKFATPETVEYVHGLLNGYEYVPVDAKGVYIDPAIERGDMVDYGDVNGLVANTKWTFDGLVTADIETPLDNEDNYDEPYNTLIQQQFKRKVSLGDSYQGVSIGRQDGIQMLLSPDGTEENAVGRWYSDLNKGQAFQTRDSANDEWFDWMYFDMNEKVYKLSLYDTSEELGDRFSDIEISLDEIAGKVEGVSFGSILQNGTLENDDYAYWEDNVNSTPLHHHTGLTFRTGMTNYTIFEPIEDDTLLSGWKMSFFANGEEENRYFKVLTDYKYGYRIRRVSGVQPFTLEIKEYNDNQTYLRKQTFTFDSTLEYNDIVGVEFGSDVGFIGLNYIITGVDVDNRLELAETMFGIGAPKPYVENVDGIRSWAQSQFQLQQNQIDLKVAQTDFTGDKLVSMISLQPSNIKIASKNLELDGLVKFTNLTDGTTTISGGNIKTGTINANLVTVTNLNAANITSGTLAAVRIPNLDASKITTGRLSSDRINFNNATGTNVNLSGAITASSGKIAGFNISGNDLVGNNVAIKPNEITLGNNGKIGVSKKSQGQSIALKNRVLDLGEDTGFSYVFFGGDLFMARFGNGLTAAQAYRFDPTHSNSTLGFDGSGRWNYIYLRNQPNVSSDLRHKFAIQDIPSDLIERLSEIKPKMYLQGTKWNFGYIAQDVERALFLWATKRHGKDAKHYVDKFAMLHKDESMLSLLYGELAVLKEQQIMNEIIKLNNRLEILENERH